MQSTPTGIEKRVFSRIPCLVDLEVSREANPFLMEKVEAVDLSLLGVGFEAPEPSSPMEPGETVTVGMEGLRPIRGQVRWNSGERVGVQFSGRFHDIVESWVGEVLAAQGVRLRDLLQD